MRRLVLSSVTLVLLAVGGELIRSSRGTRVMLYRRTQLRAGRRRALAVGVAGLLALAACGDESDNTAATPTTEGPTVTEAPPTTVAPDDTDDSAGGNDSGGAQSDVNEAATAGEQVGYRASLYDTLAPTERKNLNGTNTVLDVGLPRDVTAADLVVETHDVRAESWPTPRRHLLVLAVAGATLLAACGGNSSGEAIDDTSTTTPTTTTPTMTSTRPEATATTETAVEPNDETACDAEPVVLTTPVGVDFVRTPDACFEGLPGWSYEPYYGEIDGLRQAYIDEARLTERSCCCCTASRRGRTCIAT